MERLQKLVSLAMLAKYVPIPRDNRSAIFSDYSVVVFHDDFKPRNQNPHCSNLSQILSDC